MAGVDLPYTSIACYNMAVEYIAIILNFIAEVLTPRRRICMVNEEHKTWHILDSGVTVLHRRVTNT